MTDVSRIWPPPGEGAAFGWWIAIAEKLGAKFPLARPFLICVRGVRPGDEQTHPMRSVAGYDDTGVLLWPEGVETFPMSSHAYQVNSRFSPDVDGDGRGDVGTICPGRYVLHSVGEKYPTFALTLPGGGMHLPCWRDTDHDGVISHDERERVYSATEILLHGGVDDPPDAAHHFSIGCQCAALKWRQLLLARMLAGRTDADYVLVTAEDLLPLVPQPAEQANA